MQGSWERVRFLVRRGLRGDRWMEHGSGRHPTVASTLPHSHPLTGIDSPTRTDKPRLIHGLPNGCPSRGPGFSRAIRPGVLPLASFPTSSNGPGGWSRVPQVLGEHTEDSVHEGASPDVQGSFVRVLLRSRPINGWPSELRDSAQIRARIIACGLLDGRRRRLVRVFEFSFHPNDGRRARDFLRTIPHTLEISTSELGPGNLIVIAAEPAKEPCLSILRLGATCDQCPLISACDRGGWVEWGFTLPSSRRRFLRRLLVQVSQASPTIVVKIGNRKQSPCLTAGQFKAVSTAFRLGYFETPRVCDLSAVAKALMVSRTATLGRLRRGVHRLIENADIGHP